MKAMIFAAGTGSRLKPLTDHTPKALIPIGGKPMLEHVILKLKSSGRRNQEGHFSFMRERAFLDT